MLHEDSPALKALIQSFARSQQKVNDILLKTKGNTVQEFTFNVQKAIKQNIFEMNNKVQKWAIQDLAKAYGQGEEFATQKAKANTDIPTAPLGQERPLNAYIELMNATTHVGENVMHTVNKTIAEITKDGRDASIYEVKEALKKELVQNGGNAGYVQYKNGMKMPYDSYAQMYARTARIETANTGVLDRCKQIGVDLVVCRSMPTCCPTCKKYSDHVFSISGTSTKYPPLYNGPNSPFQNGYNVIHPNDRCEFVPFIEELHNDEELQNIQKESNVFTEYSKHDKLFKIYNKQQAILRQNRAEEREYFDLKRLLGNEMPYTTLGGFRRARREKSLEYQRVKEKLTEYTQFQYSNLKVQEFNLSRFIHNKKVLAKIKDVTNNSEKVSTSYNQKYWSSMRPFSDDSDAVLHDMCEDKHFTSKPRVLSQSEFAKLKDKDFIFLYRGLSNSEDGVTAKEFANQFKYGKLYCGKGNFGNGTYTAENKEIAYTYGDEVIEMALPKTANIINYQELLRLRVQMENKFDNEYFSRFANEQGGNWASNFISSMFRDVSKIAVDMNYDAIRVPYEYYKTRLRGEWDFKEEPKPYYIILNRSKVVVKE